MLEIRCSSGEDIIKARLLKPRGVVGGTLFKVGNIVECEFNEAYKQPIVRLKYGFIVLRENEYELLITDDDIAKWLD